jgi:anti-anti-sigma factor
VNEADAKPAQLALSGELTIYCANELRDLLSQALSLNRDVCVDLGDVSDIDTAGLQLLLVARRELEAKGHRLGLQGYGGPLTNLLKLYRLT